MNSFTDLILSFLDEEIRWKSLRRWAHVRELSLYAFKRITMDRQKISDHMKEILKGKEERLGLLPLFENGFDVEAVTTVARAVESVYGLRPRLMRSWSIPRSILTEIDDPHGDRVNLAIDGDRLISNLTTSTEMNFYGRVLVVTDVPIHTKNNGWVLGYAGLVVPVGAVSTARYNTSQGDRLETLHNVTVHEITHMYGIPHCEEQECLMNASAPVFAAELCDLCTGRVLVMAKKSNLLQSPASSRIP